MRLETENNKVYAYTQELSNWEHNPRTISKDGFERLKTMIQRLGQFIPLTVTKDGIVLSGNMRLKAFQDLGIERVWVDVVEADTEEKRIEYALAANDRAGKYESDLLADLLGSFPQIDWKQYSVDLDDPLNLGEFIERYDTTREDTAPEVNETPKSKPGELYALGNHRLLCGDATKQEDYEKLMGTMRARLVFTDPPYNVAYEGGGGSKREGIMNDKMTNEQFYEFLRLACSNMLSYANGVFYICMSPKELGTLKHAYETSGGHWQSFIIWVKNRFTLGGSDYQPQYEPILYGWNQDIKNHFFVDDRTHGNVWYDIGGKAKYEDGKTYINIGGIRLELDGKVTGKIMKGKRKTDVWQYDRPAASKEHPCLPAGEKVYIDDKWQSIENVVKGKSNYGQIVATSTHIAEQLVSIKLIDKTETKSTTNHPFLVVRRNTIAWIEAGQIRKGDYILTNEKIHNGVHEKRCSQCGEYKQITKEYWYFNKRGWLQSGECKKCIITRVTRRRKIRIAQGWKRPNYKPKVKSIQPIN